MPASEPTYAQKRAILESDGGRLFGWNVRLRGERVSTLSFHGFSDHFWDEYVLSDVSAAYDLESQAFWDTHIAELRFASTAWPELAAPTAFGVWNPRTGRLPVRGLHLDRIRLTPIERLRYFLGL